jgi:hypothetical protein
MTTKSNSKNTPWLVCHTSGDAKTHFFAGDATASTTTTHHQAWPQWGWEYQSPTYKTRSWAACQETLHTRHLREMDFYVCDGLLYVWWTLWWTLNLCVMDLNCVSWTVWWTSMFVCGKCVMDFVYLIAIQLVYFVCLIAIQLVWKNLGF